jgi:predicted transcriptional regulator
MTANGVFSLRLRDDRLRSLVRELAKRLGISQNELIEQAIEREVVVRGGLLSEDLRSAADRIAALSEEQYQRMIDRSIAAFVAGEANPEPLRARRISIPDPQAALSSVPAAVDGASSGGLDIAAVYRAGRA